MAVSAAFLPMTLGLLHTTVRTLRLVVPSFFFVKTADIATETRRNQWVPLGFHLKMDREFRFKIGTEERKFRV